MLCSYSNRSSLIWCQTTRRGIPSPCPQDALDRNAQRRRRDGYLCLLADMWSSGSLQPAAREPGRTLDLSLS
jgi:hypothetical protein